MFILINYSFYISFINKVSDYAYAFVDILLSSCYFHCFLYVLEHYFLSKNIVHLLYQISPDENSKSVHQKINTSLNPNLLIFLNSIVKVFKACIFQSFNQCFILRKILIRSIWFRFKHFSKEYFARNEIFENKSLLGWGFDIDHLEAFLCLFKRLINESMFGF